jgi:dolichol-phosphate mannosyltransferase
MSFKAWMSGFTVVEIPITFADRFAGTSKMSTGIIREALRVVWMLARSQKFRRRPRQPQQG